MTKQLFSVSDIAGIIGISKQAVNEAERKGRIEAPKYRIGLVKGWTFEQVQKIKENRK